MSRVRPLPPEHGLSQSPKAFHPFVVAGYTQKCLFEGSHYFIVLNLYVCAVGLWGVGGTVASESALRSAEALLSRVRTRHWCPGQTGGLRT
ncbi:hypothetical protein PoB_001842800 [Plakobranchus ocellatus]|uniref:Uncharacterized protein n=1 Tax=Plakobranchus ocellatus TaxID=259542 RepID=A0AAV3ZB20_9GAST|nr:hypothetical protein PoB_001842800 [Plakobranchus ocellatus]